MEIEAIRDERSPVLIATFQDGYASGWRFAVPEVFKGALDIKQTPRKIGDRTESIYTQGKQFAFIQGSLFYDDRSAYELEWGEALKHLKLSIQIAEVATSQYVVTETIQTVSQKIDITVTGKGESAKAKEKTLNDGLTIKKSRMQYGQVKFKVFRPNKARSAVEEVGIIECDQEEFVALLQTGTVRTTDNKTLDLFNQFAL
jgi:hypothetical protein